MENYWSPMVPELSVLNFEKSLFFYTELLGFKIRNQRANPNFIYLEHGQIQIMLEEIHEAAWITGKLILPLGRGINFQMQVDNVLPLVSRLKAAEITLFREPKETWYDIGDCLFGQLEFLVQDPDGYLLRFMQYLGEKSK